MDEIAMQRRAMERELRAAIASKNFEIHDQPIYACSDGRLQSYEALLRWTHPQLGPISPCVFTIIAEECGPINELGAWVLRRACGDARSFPDGVGVSVNFSTIQLGSYHLLADVARALDELHLLPSRLELEMTESALMENVDFAKTMIEDLKALGVGVALDDFGTGYSSLAYIHRFRLDRIKIDRSFVQAYELRSESRAVGDAVMVIAAPAWHWHNRRGHRNHRPIHHHGGTRL
jgi:EAL domain-containing protein (putative c-di-GMP-specific phosphodiesterase class I)